MITIFVTFRPKFMILAAILILCKLEGQDVEIILVSTIFGFSMPKLTKKS